MTRHTHTSQLKPKAFYVRRLLLQGIFFLLGFRVLSAENTDSLVRSLELSRRDTLCVEKLNRISKNYFSHSDYDKAIDFAKKGLFLADSLHNPFGKAVSYNRLGSIYAEKGDFSQALSYFFESLKIKEAIGDLKGASFSYNNIGNIYLELGKTDYALLYISKSLALKEKIKDSLGISNSLMNLGNVYSRTKDYSKALNRYLKAYEIREHLHVENGMAALLLNIGEAYSHDSLSTAKSLDAYTRSYALAQKSGEKNIMATLLHNSGIIYIRRKDYDKALASLNQSLALSQEIGARDLERNAYHSLAEAYSAKGDFKAAYIDYVNYTAIKDTILNVESAKQFADMTGRYEMEKKDRAITTMKNEGLIRDLTISRQGVMRNLLFVLLGLTLLMFILVYSRYRVKQRANKLLSEQNWIIENKNEELEKLSIVASETINGVLIASANGEIEWANQGFTKLLGYDIDEFKKLKGSNLLKASANPRIDLMVQESVRDKKSVSYEAINTTRDGKEIWVQSTLTPILNESGEIRKLVVIDSNITELKKAEKLIRKKNQSITDSIEYARRIQQAMLPSQGEMNRYLPEHALFYTPKDIVSGDFYWLYGEEKGAHSLIVCAVADCTGHGVPGALMSMIGSDQLNRIVREGRQFSPAKVLAELNKSIKNAMQKTDPDSKDGMEIGICLIDRQKQEVRYAGARRPLYIFRDTEQATLLEEVPCDKMSIGGETPFGYEFSEQVFSYSGKSLNLYLSSDGYSDQFGGEPRRKYSTAAFREMLMSLQAMPMNIQAEAMSEKYKAWKGSGMQTDDVTVLGIRLNNA